MSIGSLHSLRAHLQTAIEIEWSTIPPYLCALWSLGDEHNRPAATCIRDVVMEEMLHLTLAANVLNALGGEPCLALTAPCRRTRHRCRTRTARSRSRCCGSALTRSRRSGGLSARP